MGAGAPGAAQPGVPDPKPWPATAFVDPVPGPGPVASPLPGPAVAATVQPADWPAQGAVAAAPGAVPTGPRAGSAAGVIDESTRRADPPRRTYKEDPARYGGSYGQHGPPGGHNAQRWPEQPQQKPRRSRKLLLGVGATVLALAAAAGVTAFVL